MKTLTVKVPPHALATRCSHARSAYRRLIGLLNHARLEAGEGLLLEPCNQIHMFFMRFAIDAVFLTADNRVIAWGEYRPWSLSKLHFKSRKVLELPLGTCRTAGLKIGDQLEINENPEVAACCN